MSELDPSAVADGGDPPPGMAGALLRVAREAAGLSIDAVAQQLKLAPRQVKSLEDGDFTHLPGRTFVRGFVRAYARVVHLDPERVLLALPAGAAAPALEAPALQQTAPTIGELPTGSHTKSSWARWAIPLTLAAIVAAAMAYEWMRPAGDARVAAPREQATPAPRSPVPKDGETALPNPLATGTAVAAAPDASVPSPGAVAPGASPAAATGAGTPAATIGDAALQLAFRDYSWTEVRDRSGRVLISGMNPGGTSQSVNGAPPFEIVIGNAADVTVRFQGQAVDLAPHTRQNVARLTLP